MYGPSQFGNNFPALASRAFPNAFRNTKSPALNSLLLTSLLYQRESFCWYLASLMVADSQYLLTCFTALPFAPHFQQGKILRPKHCTSLFQLVSPLPLHMSVKMEFLPWIFRGLFGMHTRHSATPRPTFLLCPLISSSICSQSPCL